MLLQNDDMNGGNYFVNNRMIYDDVFVDEYVSHFDTKNFMPIMLGVPFFEEHSGIMLANIILDYEMVDSRFAPFIEYHFVIDEEWYNKHYGEDSNKVLRTLATGQSDISRHEAYTKVTGLNEFNSLTPEYNSLASLEELMNQISEILSEYEISSSDLCVTSTVYNNKTCGTLSISQNWTKIVSNELPPQIMIFSGEFTDDNKLNAKLFEGFNAIGPGNNYVSISKEDAIKLANLIVKACKQGYRLPVLTK